MRVKFSIHEEMNYEIDNDIIEDMDEEERENYICEQSNQWKENMCGVEWEIIEE